VKKETPKKTRGSSIPPTIVYFFFLSRGMDGVQPGKKGKDGMGKERRRGGASCTGKGKAFD
jgi:hypothetical protein